MFSALADLYEVGTKMRCQEIIGPFIVDFTIPSKMLALEIDGPSHRYHYEQDIRKDRYLADLGFIVLRVENKDVKKHVTSIKRLVQGYRTKSGWKTSYTLALEKGKRDVEYPGQLSFL